jgi:IS30 family transposase
MKKWYAHKGVPKRSAAEVTRGLVWDLWEEGLPMMEIASQLKVRENGVRAIIGACGGIRPAQRCRSQRVLSAAEREEISRGLKAGCSMREIARHLRRAPSSISREVRRHGGMGFYRAFNADERAWRRARRPKRCLLARDERLRQLVTQKLLIDWSPEQISWWLKKAYPADETMRVSHETIYRSLFVQARGVLKQELTAHLRRRQRMRRNRNAINRAAGRGHILDAVCIRERPAQVEDRAVPGHWEGDLLCGDSHSQIATLVERQSRFVMLVRVPSKSTEVVVAALSKHVRKLPSQLRRSLTWDRGFELSAHKRFTLATQMQVYFCDPRSPWQRGSNENTNGLLRQYFPKGEDISGYSQRQLDEVAMRLNQRPRKRLDFSTPAQRLAQSVATTG